MALLKNITVAGSNANSNGGSSTSYGFPSSSFTHQKQPIMPSDQKAKLLAMHRDGKANAGIYVAVVLLVYLILVIILLCRYAKRRRPSPTDLSALDSTGEQGRFHFLNLNVSKLSSCDGQGCYNGVTHFCFGRCQNVSESSKRVSQGQDDSGGGEKEQKNLSNFNKVCTDDDQLGNRKGEIEELPGNKDPETEFQTNSLEKRPHESSSANDKKCNVDEEENEDDSVEEE